VNYDLDRWTWSGPGQGELVCQRSCQNDPCVTCLESCAEARTEDQSLFVVGSKTCCVTFTVLRAMLVWTVRHWHGMSDSGIDDDVVWWWWWLDCTTSWMTVHRSRPPFCCCCCNQWQTFVTHGHSTRISESKYRSTVVLEHYPDLFMAALRSRCGHYILPCSFFFLSFFRRLFSAVPDWMSTILPHMMWP